MSWKNRTSATSYRFMRVSRSTGYETDMIRVLKGGSITRNNDVRIMETAEAELVGSLNVGPDFIAEELKRQNREDLIVPELLK